MSKAIKEGRITLMQLWVVSTVVKMVSEELIEQSNKKKKRKKLNKRIGV